jgi:hypothetical protein
MRRLLDTQVFFWYITADPATGGYGYGWVKGDILIIDNCR